MPRKESELEARPLSERELAFCWQFVNGPEPGNGAAAARYAGYSARSAKVTASRLLDRPAVLLEIARLRSELVERTQLSRDAILKEMQLVAFGRLKHIAEWDEDTLTLRPSEYLDDDKAAAIQSIEANVSEVLIETAIGGAERVAINRVAKVKARMHPKLPALNSLLRAITPKPQEGRNGAERQGGGASTDVTIVLEGGPTGLEVAIAPGVTVKVEGE